MNKSVTETGGVFEELDTAREPQDASSNPNIYFIDDDSVKDTAASHQTGDVSPETCRS